MDHLYKEIVSFQQKCNDYLDDPSHSLAGSLKREVQALEDDAQVRKNPHSIEDRVKRLIQLLEEAGKENVMSHDHANELIERCEDFREELQKLR